MELRKVKRDERFSNVYFQTPVNSHDLLHFVFLAHVLRVKLPLERSGQEVFAAGGSSFRIFLLAAIESSDLFS